MEGDYESVYAHIALQRLHILPSTFLEMEQAERAFVIASIDIVKEEEIKEAKKAKNKL